MSQQRTILVVDDDGDLRDLLRRILETAGYFVEEATCSNDVIERGGHVDMILLDLKIDGPDGKEALEELRRRKIWTPVVILTGSCVDAELEARLRRLKIVALLTKDVSFADLRMKVLAATKEKLRTRQAFNVLSETNRVLDECLRVSGNSGLYRAV